MPGFSAEGSLYRGKTQYNVTANHCSQQQHLNGTTDKHRSVIPQLPIRLGLACGACVA
jgi:hypothetical protein